MKKQSILLFCSNEQHTDYKSARAGVINVDPYLPVKGINKITSPSSDNGHWETVCHTSYVPITLEHDGILNSKEVIIPESKGVKIVNKRVPGVNHQEMGNNIEMRKLFDVIYKTDTYDKVFNLSN